MCNEKIEAGKPKILVVDDEKGMRDFLSILLRSEGYEVECVSSGASAIERMEKGLNTE